MKWKGYFVPAIIKEKEAARFDDELSVQRAKKSLAEINHYFRKVMRELHAEYLRKRAVDFLRTKR